MSRNGSGVYSAPASTWNPPVSGTAISDTDWIALLADLTTAMSASIANDGQTTCSASIPFAAGATIKGVATNSDAATGYVGEFLSANASAQSLSTDTPANVTSISLTAGDWDVSGTVKFIPAGGAAVTVLQVAVNSTSATVPGITGGLPVNQLVLAFTVNQAQSLPVATVRVSVAITTTYYLVGRATFGAGTCTADGYISARRAR